MQLALFDFDGTITTDDSLIKFIRFSLGHTKFTLGMLVLSPILMAYKLKLVPNFKAKQLMLSYYFKGMSERKFREHARIYSLTQIENILRPKAMERIEWHKEQGHKIIVVSASIECWLKPWCDSHNLELIATTLEFEDGVVTGKFKTSNCYGAEKVSRLKKHYDLDAYNYIYAYGDSNGDMEMLIFADEGYYKPFKSG